MENIFIFMLLIYRVRRADYGQPGAGHYPHGLSNHCGQVATQPFIYYRKSILHLLKRMFHVRLSRCSTDLR